MEFIFKINDTSKINITIPDLPEKFNYYYEPTEKLHRFDEVTIAYTDDSKSIELAKDTFYDEMLPFHLKLYYTLYERLALPAGIEAHAGGEALNMYYHGMKDKDQISNFLVWCSAKDTATLMYNFENKIYLEIVPLYHWNSFDPEPENENYVTFEEFMKTYKPYAVHIISREIAKEWLKQTTKIIEMVGSKDDDFILENLKEHNIDRDSIEND